MGSCNFSTCKNDEFTQNLCLGIFLGISQQKIILKKKNCQKCRNNAVFFTLEDSCNFSTRKNDELTRNLCLGIFLGISQQKIILEKNFCQKCRNNAVFSVFLTKIFFQNYFLLRNS